MGDFYERIVDVEVGGEEAAALAGRMVDWLAGEGLLTRERTRDGVYSLGAEDGYVPGPGWARAVTGPADADWPPGPVAVLLGRSHHTGGQGQYEAEYADCPRCGNRTVIIAYPEALEADPVAWLPFEEGIETWRETGAGSAPCASCGSLVPVTEWEWDSAFALGALAFDFWGWPPLSPAFLAEFGRRLGHRTVELSGKF